MLEDIEFEKCVYYGLYDGGFYYDPKRDGEFDWYKYLEGRGFPVKLIQLAYENILMHGELPASIKIFEGIKGNVVRIMDSGNGFDYKDKIEKLRGGEGYSSHQMGGSGLRIFDMEGYEVSFEGSGNIVNFMPTDLLVVEVHLK